MSAELLSALSGLIGSLLLAFPLFVDFRLKRKRQKDLEGLDDGAFTREDAAAMRPGVDRIGMNSVLEADTRMAFCALAGCLFLVLSFLILLFARHGAV